MQEINLTLKIPNGTVVYLDESMEEIIYDIKNVHHMWDYDMLGYYWIMEDGELRCLDCDL